MGAILGRGAPSGADYDRAHYLTAAPRHATFLINSEGVFFLARSARARPAYRPPSPPPCEFPRDGGKFFGRSGLVTRSDMGAFSGAPKEQQRGEGCLRCAAWATVRGLVQR